MRTYLDCIACLVRQSLDAARMVSDDPAAHEALLREVLRWASRMDLDRPPPFMAQRIHRRLREVSGVTDPYREAKRGHNRLALRLRPAMEASVAAQGDPLAAAVRVAIAGNVIDMGAGTAVSDAAVRRSLERTLAEPVAGDLERFRRMAAGAREILYLADNAGEIVFDRLLVERLAPARVTVAVRGGPIINDALREDALAAGLDRVAAVIDNGSDAPGTILDDCRADFRRRFMGADLVVAKGQGNFETLSEAPRPVVFLFKVKCPVIETHAGHPLGAHVLTLAGAAAAVPGR